MLNHFITLFLASAPWLLMGLVIAGMLKVFIPTKWLHRQLGGEGLVPVTKAALIGAPLPLCSCGVIPAAVGLRRAGASKGATTSFLVATPETGVDSVSLSYALLGPFMAIIRPIAAITSAIVAGTLVGSEAKKQQAKDASQEKKASCCSHKEEKAGEEPRVPIGMRIGQGFKFAFTTLIADTALWLLIGLFFAALVQSYVSEELMAQWGQGIVGMTLMVLVSIPMYICATASTPIAAGLLLSGVSPGAVLVFMLAGPATNIASLGVIKSELGNRAIAAYLVGVIATAMAFGMLTNYLASVWELNISSYAAQHQHSEPGVLTIVCAIALAVAMSIQLAKKLKAKLAPKKKCCCSK